MRLKPKESIILITVMVRCMLMSRFVDYVSFSIITEPINLFYNETRYISDPLDLYRSLAHCTQVATTTN